MYLVFNRIIVLISVLAVCVHYALLICLFCLFYVCSTFRLRFHCLVMLCTFMLSLHLYVIHICVFLFLKYRYINLSVEHTVWRHILKILKIIIFPYWLQKSCKLRVAKHIRIWNAYLNIVKIMFYVLTQEQMKRHNLWYVASFHLAGSIFASYYSCRSTTHGVSLV